ncbi:MAG: 50S ribosomal protein L4 [Deltaproteobacteria bacterium]|nr:MAG: 50S ribosomal protein L4 [Deltaproteobacteria bacterium]
MSEVTIYDSSKKKVGSFSLPEKFEKYVNIGTIYQTVLANQTNLRQGNAKVKTRHEVSGSTKKIYRQKGTGGARHGDRKAPLFVGGGQAFGPKPKDYDVRVPQKIRKNALRAAIIDRNKQEKFWVLDEIKIKEPKTKKALEIFNNFGISNALVILTGSNDPVERSIRNLKNFSVRRVDEVSVRDILRHEHLVLTKDSYEKILERV